MTGSSATVAATDALIRRLAYRGRGIVTARAAAAEGINGQALLRATQRGTVHPTGHRGVYSVFAPNLHSARDRLQASWTAIDLTTPPWERLHHAANVVSHHTALELHSARQPTEPFEFVLGSLTRLINRPGVLAHRQLIEADEITLIDHLPVQTVGAAAADLMRTYRDAPELTVPKLLADALRAGADPSTVAPHIGPILANPWARRDQRHFLADLFRRADADPELVRSAIFAADWHRIGFWRIQIDKGANRAWITRLFTEAVAAAAASLANPDRRAAAAAADRYLRHFTTLTHSRVALFDEARQQRIRLHPPDLNGAAGHVPRSEAITGTALDEAREAVAEIAGRHHGIVTTAEAGRHGVQPAQIRSFVAEQLLHRTSNRGVYILGTGSLTGLDRLRAAWFAADTRTPMDERVTTLGAVITGPTAAALRAGQVPPAPYHLALGSKNRHIRRRDVLAFRSRPLTPADVTVIHDMPVTVAGADLELGAATTQP